MILNDIKTKLEEIDPNVFYGMVDPVMRETIWDYIVFNRTKTSPSTNRTGYSRYYSVHVVRENFVPDGLDVAVIEKVLEIPGMRLAEDMAYTYVAKPGTNVVVEMVSITFMKPNAG